MKMFPAATADILNYVPFSRNCNLGCKYPYFAAVPSLADVTVFMNLGTVRPVGIDLTVINLCTPFDSDVLESNCGIIAFNGSYWYVVIKNFTGPAYTRFIISASVSYIDATTKVYFSEQYETPSACDSLTKVSVCYPYNYNSEDTNGIYIGQPDMSQPVLGSSSLFYHHEYWVKTAEVIETSNKITFTANLYKNFNTDLKKLFEFRPEKVPGWYKDYLLAVYFRGQFFINGTPALMSDLNFENIDERSDQWKAYAVITTEVKGSFGCTPIECPTDCVCVPVTLGEITLPNGFTFIPYSLTIPISGTPTFLISSVVKPAWLTIAVDGSNLVFSGTPVLEDVGTAPVSFILSNDCGAIEYDITIEVEETKAHFATRTFVSDDVLNVVEIANISGIPGSTVHIVLDNLINGNGGTLKVNGSPAFMGNDWSVILDAGGHGVLNTEINGVTNPSTVILGHFTIDSVDIGTIGTPDVYQISKVF